MLFNEKQAGSKNPACKKVVCIETNIEYSYMKLAAKEVYGDEKFLQNIQRSIKEKRKVKNFSWKYA